MKRVLLLGGSGYIGSLFREWFDGVYDITSIDIGWFIPNIHESVDYRRYNDLVGYDAIILLAGHSSVKMCECGDMSSSFLNNVANFIDLLECVPPGTKFIYASSSSVYGNVGNGHATEEMTGFTPMNLYDISKHTIDMYAQKSDVEYYGLRLGTVNGYSPHLRTDIMINAMVHSAMETNTINLYNKHVNRPILYIVDLMNAIERIIKTPDDHRGIYNLSTFDAVVEDIAHVVADITKAQVIEKSVKLNPNDPKVYDFNISTEKFRRVFDFEFSPFEAGDVAEELVNMYSSISIKSHRNEPKFYV